MDESSAVKIREFESRDKDGVKGVCFQHFRGLSFAALLFYVGQHRTDLFVFFLIMKIFQTWTHSVIAIFLFLAYIFARARIEMELYIRRDCSDLEDIQSKYLNKEKSKFWVAEDERNNSLIGCAGVAPSKHDPHIAQLIRLVVHSKCRRKRVGSRLLAQLESFSKQQGFKEVRLYTNNLNAHPLQFVKQQGYRVEKIVRRGLMRGDLLTWRKSLEENSQSPVSSLSVTSLIESTLD
eukprot:GHVP01065806.1.p1 GENE.GHVP01065806.1~~GHVP01065806.1.p1  ORF type:complete len:246 (+),score=21.75 GHVP01065806.1:31-738(+)